MKNVFLSQYCVQKYFVILGPKLVFCDTKMSVEKHCVRTQISQLSLNEKSSMSLNGVKLAVLKSLAHFAVFDKVFVEN